MATIPKRTQNLIGQRFGKLTVTEYLGRLDGERRAKWRCVCDCGGEVAFDTNYLKSGCAYDCGCSRRHRLVGQKIDKLFVMEYAGHDKRGTILWRCKCDCGNEVVVSTAKFYDLKRGRRVSCGCTRTEKTATHRMSNTKLYHAWTAIKGRCKNPKNPNYCWYGGRGIDVCKEWDESFEAFKDWSFSNGYREDLTIDRIDNDKGYYPDNCRWVPQKIQANNTSRNHYIEINGEVHSITKWSEIYGISIATVWNRIKNCGWSDIEAVTTPVIKHGYTRKNPAYTHADN